MPLVTGNRGTKMTAAKIILHRRIEAFQKQQSQSPSFDRQKERRVHCHYAVPMAYRRPPNSTLWEGASRDPRNYIVARHVL
jgi:hypothetical protein